MLEKEPKKRLTVGQILSHPWLSDAKDTVELFTLAEKLYIKNQYTYNARDSHNRNTPGGGGADESDAFVDAALETNYNTELKNAETRSVILAPFNSTKSNIETDEEFFEQIKEELQERKCIKFAPRVRDLDKQYEANNNAELDNGVQHEFG